MNLTISYNSRNRKSTVHQNSALLLEGYSKKKWGKQQWHLFTSTHEEIASIELKSKLFSLSAMIRVSIELQKEPITLAIQYHGGWLTYSLSFRYGGCLYEVHPHLEDRFSIFREQAQVASLRKIDYSDFTSRWVLLANNTLNASLLIGLAYALFISTEKHFDHWGDSPSSYWLKEAVPLNTHWRPS